MSLPSLASVRNGICVAGAVVLVAACGDPHPTATVTAATDLPASVIQVLDCTARITTGTVSCGAPAPIGASRNIIGGQNVYVRLTSSNIIAADGIFQVDVTVQNLLNEAMGTPDGTVADPEGIQIFFHTGPTTTAGVGMVSVANADGTGTFTAGNQPFYRYTEILARDQVSDAKTWQFAYDAGVESFSFQVYVETDVQYLLVINELLANPGDNIYDSEGEWFEVYNAGTLAVDMQNLVVADSAMSGRRPYHLIASSVRVAPGGYVVFGNNSNTTTNGGVPVDYSYGNAMAFANSIDALKISRVYGTDTLTLDRTQYASAAISAQNGISRELRNPALDNANMDGSNWADASVTAVYGPGGRGTPGAQNSTFTP